MTAVLEEDHAVAAGVVAVDVAVAERLRLGCVALHPHGAGIAVEVQRQVHGVAAVVEEPAAVGHHQALEGA